MCTLLLERGVYINPVVSPATPVGYALLRTSYTATHTREQLDKAIANKVCEYVDENEIVMINSGTTSLLF